MSNILSFIKLDSYSIKPLTFSIVCAMAAAIIIGIAASQPTMIIMVLLTFTAYFMSVCFAVCEKNSLNKLYGVLPIKRRQIVVGRYLFSLLLAIINGAVSALLTFVVSSILNITVTALAYSQFLSGSFFIFCLFIAIQFPLYFKFDYSKVAAVAVLPFVLVFAIGLPLLTTLSKNPDFAKSLAQLYHNFLSNIPFIWLAGLLIGLILMGLSCLLSCKLYKNRELS